MEPILLDQTPFEVDANRLMQRLHIRPGSAMAREFGVLLAEALPLGRPKTLFGVAYIEERAGDTLTIDGVPFTSHVLAVNLAQVHRVFAYIATCGAELGEWAHGLTDVLHQFWGEEIKIAALGCASQTLATALEAHFAPGKTATMNPGSLPDWPLREQGPMFRLLGQTDAIGVTLNESYLMSPNKSVTGLRFATELSYENCQLCPRSDCPGRRAPYDAALWQSRYAKEA
jgi:hypothetical protein